MAALYPQVLAAHEPLCASFSVKKGGVYSPEFMAHLIHLQKVQILNLACQESHHSLVRSDPLLGILVNCGELARILLHERSYLFNWLFFAPTLFFGDTTRVLCSQY